MALGPGSRIQLGLPDGPIVALRTAGGDGQPKGGTVLVNQPSRKNLPQQLDILMQANKALESENQRLNEQNQSMREKNTALGSENERLAQKVIAPSRPCRRAAWRLQLLGLPRPWQAAW